MIIDFQQLKQAYLPARSQDAHKGDFGRVWVVGGQLGMLGAVLMAGEAALRMGAGKVTIATDAQHIPFVPLYRAELMSCDALQLNAMDVVALGPGMSDSDWCRRVYQLVLAQHLEGLVIDAGALALLKQFGINIPEQVIITPHPGEAAMLLGCSADEVQQDRHAAIKALVVQYQCTVVLKGAKTLVASPDSEIYACTFGNPGMASAGNGDVLTGMIAALLAQGVPKLPAAQLGVTIHAKSADIAVQHWGEQALLATDSLHYLAEVLG